MGTTAKEAVLIASDETSKNRLVPCPLPQPWVVEH